jgi:hypothetical protein
MVWGPLIGAGIGLATSLLNNRNSNRRAGQVDQQLAGVPQFGRDAYQPFINRGMQAQDQAADTYQQMQQNPTSFVDQIMQSYKPSQGYQFRQKNALGAARNSAAQGGFTGTSYDQMQQAELANGLLGQDQQQYLQNILGVQGTGLAGQQHLGDMGYNASGNLADYLGNAQGMRAQLGASQNQQRGLNESGLGAAFGQFAGAGMQGLGGIGARRDAENRARTPKGQSFDPSWLSTLFGGYK